MALSISGTVRRCTRATTTVCVKSNSVVSRVHNLDMSEQLMHEPFPELTDLWLGGFVFGAKIILPDSIRSWADLHHVCDHLTSISRTSPGTRSRRPPPHPPPVTRSILPSLTKIGFKRASEYLERSWPAARCRSTRPIGFNLLQSYSTHHNSSSLSVEDHH